MDLLGDDLPVAEMAEEAELTELRDALTRAAATINAAQARFAQALAVFRTREGHAIGSGYQSFGQWATVDLGMSSRQANTLADTGAAAGELPMLRQVWESGELSTTKATTTASVATADSIQSWCSIAMEASATQLARIATAYRRNDATDTDDDEARRARGRDASHRDHEIGLWWRTRDDLVELTAVLAVDDATVVRAALEAQLEHAWREHDDAEAEAETDADTDADPEADADQNVRPHRHRSARLADALAALAATGLAAGPVPIVRGEHTEVILHVDHTYLAGESDQGRCHLSGSTTGSTSIDRATARRLACDARIRAMVHGADGSCVDLGRSQRLVSDKQRRLLTARDHGCRYPGCTNTRFVDAHHVVHWEDGGPTDLANLITLCNRHHRLHHQGVFDITADGSGEFTFFDRWRKPLRPPRVHATGRCRPAPGNPRARSGGDPRFDLDLAVAAVANAAPTAS